MITRVVLAASAAIVALALLASLDLDVLLRGVEALGYLAILGGLVLLVRSGPARHVCHFPHRHPSGVWVCRCGAVRDRHGRPL